MNTVWSVVKSTDLITVTFLSLFSHFICDRFGSSVAIRYAICPTTFFPLQGSDCVHFYQRFPAKNLPFVAATAQEVHLIRIARFNYGFFHYCLCIAGGDDDWWHLYSVFHSLHMANTRQMNIDLSTASIMSHAAHSPFNFINCWHSVSLSSSDALSPRYSLVCVCVCDQIAKNGKW